MCTVYPTIAVVTPPEIRIAEAFRRELGVHLNPQALRVFIRKEWGMLSIAAHEIHDA